MNKFRNGTIQLITKTFNKNRSLNKKILATLLYITFSQLIMLICASYLDGTLYLPGNGRGLYTHYGMWAITISDPILILLVAYSYKFLFHLVKVLPYKNALREKEFKKVDFQPCANWLALDRISIWIYWALTIIGFLCWLNNIKQTINPVSIYGNDVFDAYKYRYGFYTAKLNLFYSWVIVYPAIIFTSLSLSFITRRVLKTAIEKKVLKFDANHPDGCYGLAVFGKFNLILMWPYLVIYFVIYSLLITHNNNTYLSIILPLILLTVALLLASYFTVEPVMDEVKKVKELMFKELSSRWRYLGRNPLPQNEKVLYILDRLTFVSSSGTPYSSSILKVTAIARSIPIIMTLEKIFNFG